MTGEGGRADSTDPLRRYVRSRIGCMWRTGTDYNAGWLLLCWVVTLYDVCGVGLGWAPGYDGGYLVA